MTSKAFDIHLPAEQRSPLIFASPHSGRDYTDDFVRRSILDRLALRSSEDAYVDRLFGAAPDLGAPLICARMPRAYVDLNRGPEELDPAVVTGVRRGAVNPRISSGLGVIPRVVANGRAIYSGKLSLIDAQDRITEYWQPYHTRLQRLLSDTRADFGQAVLIDCHSMPNEALESVRINGKRPDVVLGDRFGSAAAPEVMAHVQQACAAAGLVVSRNLPFAGAYIVQRYGRPVRDQHVIQLELNRALYMDEARVEPRADFEDFRRLITDVMRKLVEFGAERLPVAAE